jgi:tetratricopeptide (TPR) repeat protein
MPLKDYFVDQMDQLRGFVTAPDQAMRVLCHEPDVEPLVKKLIVALDEDDNFKHIMVPARSPYDNTAQYFRELLDEVVRQNEQYREELATLNITLPKPDDHPELAPEHRFKRYVADVADCLPDSIGSYLVVINPKTIGDEAGFKRDMVYLAKNTRSLWAKYLVFDRRTKPVLDGITDETPRAGVQLFHLAPDQIEKQVHADLASGCLGPQEKRQYIAMTGAFAFANRNYDDAAKIQTDVVKMAEQEGTPADQANALYNLGNTHLKRENAEEAEQCLARAVEICAEHDLNPMMAMALTNLGVALQRQGRMDESLQSFSVARRTFKALCHRPGEAHVLDSQAATLAHANRNQEAERAWREALAIYEGITAPEFAQLRRSGRDDILDKLRRFFEATSQAHKVRALTPQEA